jgi:hypothetical protein
MLSSRLINVVPVTKEITGRRGDWGEPFGVLDILVMLPPVPWYPCR